ncbi:MAG: type II secretion system major pseudopilin GspG [Pseudohongiella nitratireducens]|nr:type II secretion system major pseudopilin GspG [Pseudohongiella nitratireducens]MDF1623325.1 type II secretion system major pseudopilin GspG [Pseudohongiella nitratireducens]|tara:strand:- start:9046 stop:9501 length:456 start_codon:yes stop_codon:yes gene_type:complete
MQVQMKRHRQSAGFSLIEIMVVLVIMGLLISILAPNVLGRADEARVQKVFADFSAIETSLRMYRLDNYDYPTSEQGLSALIERPTMEPVPANWKSDGYLESLPVDPWGREYLYLSPGQQGAVDIFTYGADGVRGGEGQNSDYGNWQQQENL